jgi:hypothetical protein
MNKSSNIMHEEWNIIDIQKKTSPHSVHKANTWQKYGSISDNLRTGNYSRNKKKMHQKQQKICDFSKTQTTNTIQNNTNYDRVGNYANISFTRERTRLLSKCLKYIREQNYYSHAI